MLGIPVALILVISSVFGQLDLGPATNTNRLDPSQQSTLQQPGYLPPIEPAGAQANPVIATTPKPPGPTHHGRDLCTDPFHSFLCSSLKPRKPITGNHPGQNIIGANSFVAPSKVLAPPLNDIYEPEITTTTTTRRPVTFPTTVRTTTTTPRPTTTTPRPTTTTQRPTTTTTQRPTTTTQRPTTTTEKPVEPAPSSDIRTYLPPEEPIAPAAASQDPAIARPDTAEDHHHHDHHPHHHGRDLCSDPFHSFLCQPLKPRKRITGDLPNGLQGQNSFLVPQKAPIDPIISPQPSNEIDRIYLPPTTTTFRTTTTQRRTTAAPTTVIRFRPEPSNEVDRFYLPPVTTTQRPSTVFRYSPQPSNEIKVYKPPVTTTTTTTTRRPTTTTTTTRRPPPPTTTTTRRPIPTTTIRFRPEPSNEIDRVYLPPVTTTTRRPITQPPTTPFRLSPQPSNNFQRIAQPTTSAPTYLPPAIPQPSNVDERIEPAPAQDSPAIQAPDDHHHGHHGHRDICSDPFHSFLCVSPKPRKRITGALPSNLREAATNIKETKVLKEAPSKLNIIVPPLPPSTTTTTTTTPKPVQPSESRDPAPAIIKPDLTLSASTNNKPVVGYDYPKPQNPLPLPTKGYEYPKPNNPLPLPSKGYDYPAPEVKLTLPSEVKPVVGYDYPKPSSPLPLPSTGYVYPKPSSPLPLPSKGYNYPKPSSPLPLPSNGNNYPKQDNQFASANEYNNGKQAQLPTTLGYNFPKHSNSVASKSYNPTSRNSLPVQQKPKQEPERHQNSQPAFNKFEQPKTTQQSQTSRLPDSLEEARERLRQVANIGTQNSSSDLIAVNELEFTNDGGLPVRFGDRIKKRQPKRQLPTHLR